MLIPQFATYLICIFYSLKKNIMWSLEYRFLKILHRLFLWPRPKELELPLLHVIAQHFCIQIQISQTSFLSGISVLQTMHAEIQPWPCCPLSLTCISCTSWWILAGSALWNQQTPANGEKDPCPTGASPGAQMSRWSQPRQAPPPWPLLTPSSGAGLVLTTSIETWGPSV